MPASKIIVSQQVNTSNNASRVMTGQLSLTSYFRFRNTRFARSTLVIQSLQKIDVPIHTYKT